jgi:hypothetical protein
MTKIAIYGDSFAADYEGWPKYFGELMKCDVKTFGYYSTSIGYSYFKFLETHEEYDHVIFLWTDIKRVWLVSTPDKDESILQHHICFSPSEPKENSLGKEYYPLNAEYLGMPNQNISDINKKLLSTWIKTENHWSNTFRNKNLLSIIAMRDSVKHRRPDCFNIQSFDYFKTNKNKLTEKVTPGMWRITLFDMMQYSDKLSNVSEDPKSKKKFNHLTETQNKEFAQYLFESHQNKDFDIHKTFDYPPKYYTMSKSLEEAAFIFHDV